MSMPEPAPEDLAAFNAEVQKIIDRAAAEGESLTWKEASTRFGNLLKNKAENPDLKIEPERLDRVELDISNLTARVAYLENVAGGTVVGADPVGGADPGA